VSSLSAPTPGGIVPGPPVPLLFPYAAFVPTVGDGADFTSVTGIVMTVTTTTAGSDISLDFFETDEIVIPAPAALPAGLALIGAMGLRRRRSA